MQTARLCNFYALWFLHKCSKYLDKASQHQEKLHEKYLVQLQI